MQPFVHSVLSHPYQREVIAVRPSIVEVSLPQLLAAESASSLQCPCCRGDGIMVRCELPPILSWLPVDLKIYRCLQCQEVYKLHAAESKP